MADGLGQFGPKGGGEDLFEFMGLVEDHDVVRREELLA